MKRVGLVTPFFLPQIGGANRYCFELPKALAGKGVEVHLFSTPGALADPAYKLFPILTLDLRKDLKLLKSYSMDVWHSLFFYYAPLALFKPNVFVTAHGDDCFSQQVKMLCPGTRVLERHLMWRLPAGVRRALKGCLTRFEWRSEEHTSELQSLTNLVCRLLLEKKKTQDHPWHPKGEWRGMAPQSTASGRPV